VVEIQLRQEEAKLAYLAVAYHLGRPGSELDPVTKQPVEHGLAEVARALQPQLGAAVAQLTLTDHQVSRFLSGMLGSITELKAYPMLVLRRPEEGGGRRSTVPGFDRSLRHLFPAVEEDAEAALAVAEQMLMLKRQLDRKLAAAEPDPPPQEQRKRGWWPFHR
jgi:hypothetical protein